MIGQITGIGLRTVTIKKDKKGNKNKRAYTCTYMYIHVHTFITAFEIGYIGAVVFASQGTYMYMYMSCTI